MLRRRLFNCVQSDAGYVVKIRSFRGFVEYREGRHVAKIAVQPVIGKPLLNVFADAPVMWEPPFAAELVPEDRRKQIIANIVEALRFRKYPVVVVSR